ncbi:unnamed protein product [Symbiodinium natans]|uniref:Uncharacterized protein n=1 Tax=Symbiodinium natans TaxID=878477 RepID=A0A812IL78_9DINO|nr:unnamed protein product [Symbiodinium natans]
MAAVDTVLASAESRRRGRFSELLAVKADPTESTSEGERSESDSRGATTPEVWFLSEGGDGVQSRDSDALHSSSRFCVALLWHRPCVLPSKDEGPSAEEKEALRLYEAKFAENRDGSYKALPRKAFPWFTPQARGEAAPKEFLTRAMAEKESTKPRPKKECEVDSDGEEVQLCSQCGMPMGETAYRPEEKGYKLVHPECMAQIVLEDAQKQDEKNTEEQRQKKLDSRLEYQIGWRPETVPENGPVAAKLGCSPTPKGLCCLVYDEASRSVRIASTLEPAAAVNLEYLMLALKVRRTACREPLFSLDPVDPQKLETTPQRKRYEPAWLAGTSVGDIMFQADYFLKELALGEYTMPIVGMMSVFDWSEMTDANKTWAGREWFVVKKAEIRLAEDKTLVPHVKMGVEAREQVVTSKGLEDKPITSKHHPLTRFAEAFTRHFDLIAERKSVIFHLRELAKASVMAKFLVDSKISLDARWFDLAEEMIQSTTPEAFSEIPQLWNMRGNSRIQLQGGKIRDMQTGLQSNLHAIYGGVEFGLDRFQLAQRTALPGAALPSSMPGAPLPGAALSQPGRFDITGMQLGPSGRPMFMPQRFQLTQRDQPQGVDLALDKFDLSAPERFATSLPPCSAQFDSMEGRVTLGKAFLKNLQEDSYENLKAEDAKLLQRVFNPVMADRITEGDSFIPPDPNLDYVQKLRHLIQEEESLTKQRKARFSDKNFTVGMAGSEFPRSWTSRFQILREGGKAQVVVRPGLTTLKVDEIFTRTLLEDILPTAAPEFAQTTEDGMIFRIYKIGRLEVRTTQAAQASNQEVLSVFSLRPACLEGSRGRLQTVSPSEKFVKGRLYVEAIDGEHKECAKQLHLCHFYVVLETSASNVIVTEKLADGSTTWVLNPSQIEDRNSLAKLMMAVDIRMEKATVGNLQVTQESNNIKSAAGATASDRKRYAKDLFALVSPRNLNLSSRTKAWDVWIQKCECSTAEGNLMSLLAGVALALRSIDMGRQVVLLTAGSEVPLSLRPSPTFSSLGFEDLTPPQITVVSMYGITENVIRVTIRLDESGTTYCRAYDSGVFTPFSQGGTDVPTLTDCTACTYEINTLSGTNFVGSSVYDSVKGFAEHEVDITGLLAKTFYWVYCYSHDDEIPTTNVVTSSQMLGTERSVRTLDTTPPSFGTFACAETPATEDSITVTLSMNEAGRAYCKVVNKGFDPPTPNAVIAEGFYMDVSTTSAFTIIVNQITTGLGATGLEPLNRKWDYDVYCWAQDAEGYPYYGPNGMAAAEACPNNFVTTLDLTRPNMRFIMAESISASQIIITLQVDEGAMVWCAAWAADPGLTSLNYDTLIKSQQSNCHDSKGRQCGTFWIYDLDDLEDTAADGVSTQAEYESLDNWKFNQDFDIIVSGLNEETDYPYIYCYAEDDETDGGSSGPGSSPNVMRWDDLANTGPDNVHTIWAGIGTVQTLDETPPEFTQLSIKDPTDNNDRLVVTFSLNEAGTAYCRTTRSDSGETDLQINRILSANYYQSVGAGGIVGTITIDKLESSDTQTLYEASQYDVYCWAMDSAVNTQGLPRPNYMTQTYVNTPVGTTLAHAQTSPSGGKTQYVWVKDLTPPSMIYVSSEALSEDTIQITLQLNEPGTVWCMPTLPVVDATYVDTADVASGNFKDKITGASSPVSFLQYVPTAYTNIDVEVDRVVRDDAAGAAYLAAESPYSIFCFASDDWDFEATGAAQQSINFQAGNVGAPNEVVYQDVLDFSSAVGQVITLDLTPPTIQINSVSTTETTITVNLELSETGTAWCQAVRHGFNVPTILEILDSNFTSEYVHVSPTTVPVDVQILGYDRPRNWDPTYMTPLQLGTYYDIYCYADDDLCNGCKVTNGVSFNYVSTSARELKVRTLDLTPPQMRFIAAESIAHDQIIITLQVDEGAKVWCAAWDTDPALVSTGQDYETKIKGKAADCTDSFGNQCGTFWIYDMDDIVDVINAADSVTTRAEYEATTWKYNRDVDIIVSGLNEETDYPYIYCYAEDDELTPNKMIFDNALNAGPRNVYTMWTEIGTIQTLDETPPSFTKLAITDPTATNDEIVVTFALNEAGTAYCRVTLSDSGETTLRINQILSANFAAVVAGPNIDNDITINKIEASDTQGLYEGNQYDVYCWAKDSAVDTYGHPRPNYMTQSYVDTDVGVNYMTAPAGGRTRYVWLKDTTPPTLIYVTSEAITDSKLQITLQLDEPGTVWCQPALPTTDANLDVLDVDVGVPAFIGILGDQAYKLDPDTRTGMRKNRTRNRAFHIQTPTDVLEAGNYITKIRGALGTQLTTSVAVEGVFQAV